MVSPLGRNVTWLTALAMAMGFGMAVAQTRPLAADIPSITAPALVQPEGDTDPKDTEHGEPKAAVKQPTQKFRPKTQIARQIEPSPQTLAQTKLKGQPKGRSDGLRQPVAGEADAAKMEARWQEIQATLRPTRLIVLCDEFERDFPSSQFGPQVKAMQAGARQAMEIQRSAALSGDLFEDAAGDHGYRDNLIKAVRGDKNAAYQIALAYKKGTSGVIASPRRAEQWLRFSAELGNGRASWELAEIYNRQGLVADAAQFEKRALELGYQPAPRLPTRGY